MTAFDHRHVADRDAGLLGQGFLSHAALFAELADCFAKGGLGLI
jgi:hypothetical protein